MKMPVIKYGSSILRQQAQEVMPHENYSELSDCLFESLNTKEGVGLAAPQIGILKRVFVIAVSIDENEQENALQFKKAYINPAIIWKSQEQIYYNEGCLSIPDIFEDVLRPESINVTYYDSNFNLVEEQLDGIVARIFQHEYDHLDGILFIDRINLLKRKLLDNKLKQIKRYK